MAMANTADGRTVVFGGVQLFQTYLRDTWLLVSR